MPHPFRSNQLSDHELFLLHEISRADVDGLKFCLDYKLPWRGNLEKSLASEISTRNLIEQQRKLILTMGLALRAGAGIEEYTVKLDQITDELKEIRSTEF